MSQPDTNLRLFIGGISQETTELQLKIYFESFGPISSYAILYDKHTSRLDLTPEVSKGYGFINCESKKTYNRILGCKPHQINGRILEVNKALQRNGNVPEDIKSKGFRKLFIGGLGKTIVKDDLVQYFSKFGQLINAYVIYMPGTEISKGFGYVEFASVEAATQVLGIKRHFIKHKKITVENHRQSYNTAINMSQQQTGQSSQQEHTSARLDHQGLEDNSQMNLGNSQDGLDLASWDKFISKNTQSLLMDVPDGTFGDKFQGIMNSNQYLLSGWDDAPKIDPNFIENHGFQHKHHSSRPDQTEDYIHEAAASQISVEAWADFSHNNETFVMGGNLSHLPANSLESPNLFWQSSPMAQQTANYHVQELIQEDFSPQMGPKRFPSKNSDPSYWDPASVGYLQCNSIPSQNYICTGLFQPNLHALQESESPETRFMEQSVAIMDRQDGVSKKVMRIGWELAPLGIYVSEPNRTGLHSCRVSNTAAKRTRSLLRARLDESPANYRFNKVASF